MGRSRFPRLLLPKAHFFLLIAGLPKGHEPSGRGLDVNSQQSSPLPEGAVLSLDPCSKLAPRICWIRCSISAINHHLERVFYQRPSRSAKRTWASFGAFQDRSVTPSRKWECLRPSQSEPNRSLRTRYQVPKREEIERAAESEDKEGLYA
jgi:hypothetical protein